MAKKSNTSFTRNTGGYIRQRETKKGGTVYQVAVYRGKNHLGRCCYKYYTARGREEAEELLMKKQAEMVLNGSDFLSKDSASMTVAQFLELYFQEYVIDVVKPSTVRCYTNLSKYVLKLLGDKKLCELNSVILQNFYKRLLKCSPLSDKPLSLRTVVDIRRFNSVWLNIAVAGGYLKSNPNVGVKLPKKITIEETAKKEIYTVEELGILLKGIEGTSLELAVVLLLDSACRRGELLALKYSDIKWETNEISITKNMTEGINNTFHVVTPKTAAGIRTVKLTDYTMQLLKKSYTDYKKAKLARRDFVDTGLVIHKPNGEGLLPHSLYNKFCRYTKKLGLPHIRLHALRTTSITLAIQEGAKIKAVAEKVGHSSVAITSDIYLKNTNKMREETTQIMEGILQKAVNG